MQNAKNDLPKGGKIKEQVDTIFDAGYEVLKKIIKVDDEAFKSAVTDMLAQDAGNVLTQEFLNDGLRQGCAFEFGELKPLEKEKTLLQCKDPKNAVVKYFLSEIVKPTQLRNIIFGKQLRSKEFDDLLKTRLDNPQFKTAVLRLFAMDFAARGPYAKDSPAYNDMVEAITEFVSVFRSTYSSE